MLFPSFRNLLNQKFLTILGIFAMGNSAIHAATLGSDFANDAAYNSGWINGSDGGTAATFGAWTLTNGGASSGHFIGNSTSLAAGNTGGDINTTGKSFGLFAHTTQTAEAVRKFNGDTLSVGQTFSLEIAVNFRNGNKGFDLRNPANVVIFNLNIGGNDYVVSNAATGNGSIGNAFSTNTVLNLSFTQTSAVGGTWTVTRSGGITDLDSGTYSGVAENIKLYNSQTTGGGAAEDNLYANSMKVVPEPSTLALAALTIMGALIIRRRRS